MEWYIYLAVIVAGFGTGFVNTLAGSGSLISLPLLIFLGIPANVANGTNRVGVLIQNLVAAESFRRQQVMDSTLGIWLGVPSIIGAIIGAQIAANLDEEMMRRPIGVLMIVMLVVILIRPKRWLVGRPEAIPTRPSPVAPAGHGRLYSPWSPPLAAPAAASLHFHHNFRAYTSCSGRARPPWWEMSVPW